MPTKTASPETAFFSSPGIMDVGKWADFLVTGLDLVYRREYERPEQGMRYFRKTPMSKSTLKHQSYHGMGMIGLNSDAEALPYDEGGPGFTWELSTDLYRGAVAITKQLMEDELYGTIRDRQANLVEGSKLTRELVLADWFNRGFGAGSGAPGLCEDGMYFIDEDRPNAYAPAGLWSNLEASSAITPNSLFTAQLNFRLHKDERGQLAPQRMKKAIVRPEDEKAIWEILKSDLRPTDAMNAKNYQFERFDYEVYDFLTSAYIYYMSEDAGSQKNELKFGDRVSPSLETWNDGNNPDVMNQRIRMRFGIGCGRPTIWRGGIVS